MRKLSLPTLLSFILLSSCAVTYKKDKPENLKLSKEMDLKEAETQRMRILNDEKNWQHQYYEQVIFRVQGPEVVESNKRLDAICGGNEFEFKNSYQLNKITSIKFKKYPVSIKARSGFSKKVFLPKGICREINMMKKQKGKGLRRRIKQMNILYVYNVGSYVLDVTFESKFKDVELFVK